MKTTTSTLLALLAVAATTAICACETEDASHAVVENEFPTTPDADHTSIVYRVVWTTTYFADPIAPKTSSAEERTVPGTDFAYALVAPGWNPESGTPPTSLVALKSKEPLSVKRGKLLRIVVSNDTFNGSCDATPLSQEESDLITQRIFAGDFVGYTYDPKTCTLIATPPPPPPDDEENNNTPSPPPMVDAGADG